MWYAIYEIREGNQGSGEAHNRAVESCDQDLRMRIEGLGYVQVVRDEAAELMAV